MNKIVHERYPVDHLPDDLKQALTHARRVKVTLEVVESEEDERPMTFEEVIAARRPPFRSADEIMADIYEVRYGS